jgi:hypothetical protein
MSIKQPPPVKDHRNGIEVRGKKTFARDGLERACLVTARSDSLISFFYAGRV